jgi:hypothetical protein
VKLYRECLAKYMSATQPRFVSLEAFVNAMVIAEGLKRAGKNPTREKFIEAIESMNDVDIGLGSTAHLQVQPAPSYIWASPACAGQKCAAESRKYSATGRSCRRRSKHCGASLRWTDDCVRPTWFVMVLPAHLLPFVLLVQPPLQRGEVFEQRARVGLAFAG